MAWLRKIPLVSKVASRTAPVAAVGEPPERPIDHVVTDWAEHWLPSIWHQVVQIHQSQFIHDEVIAQLRDGRPTGGHIFEDEYHRIYVHAQSMAIRRQCDDDKRTTCLRRLIGQVQEERRRLTRKWYVAWWVQEGLSEGTILQGDEPFHADLANDSFDKFADAKKPNIVSGARLDRDRSELDEVAAKVIELTNKHIAHLERGARVEMTYGEFDAAIEHLGEKLQQYQLFLGRSSMLSVAPVIQTDWLEPLRRP